MPAVLLEIPTVRNASDESRLFETAQRQRNGNGIANDDRIRLSTAAEIFCWECPAPQLW